MSAIRKFRLDSPFDKQQSGFILSIFQKSRSLSMVMRSYRKKFFPGTPRKVPKRTSFERLVNGFQTDTSVRPVKFPGKTPVSGEDVERVRQYFRNNKENHLRQAVIDLGFSFGKI